MDGLSCSCEYPWTGASDFIVTQPSCGIHIPTIRTLFGISAFLILAVSAPSLIMVLYLEAKKQQRNRKDIAMTIAALIGAASWGLTDVLRCVYVERVVGSDAYTSIIYGIALTATFAVIGILNGRFFIFALLLPGASNFRRRLVFIRSIGLPIFIIGTYVVGVIPIVVSPFDVRMAQTLSPLYYLGLFNIVAVFLLLFTLVGLRPVTLAYAASSGHDTHVLFWSRALCLCI